MNYDVRMYVYHIKTMIQDKQIYNTLLTKAGISNTLPQIVSYTPIITEQDYQNGNIYRYFIYDAVENK
jgi:hypothetical protein